MLTRRNAPNPTPMRPLAGLALAVLLAHLALLGLWPGRSDTTPAPPLAAPAAFHVRATAVPQPGPAVAPHTPAAPPLAQAPSLQALRQPVGAAVPEPPRTHKPPTLSAAVDPALPRMIRASHPLTSPSLPDQEPNQSPALLQHDDEAINTVAILDPKPDPDGAPDAGAEAPIDAETLAQATPGSRAAKPASRAPAVKVKLPGPVLMNYLVAGQAKGIGYNATATLRWLPTRDTYQARLEIRTIIGKRAQTSDGQLGPQGLAPTRFSDKSRSEQAAHFVRDQGKIVFSGNAPEAALQPGAQDRLSVVLQLAAMLAGEPNRYKPGSTVAIQTVGTRDAEIWRFEASGEETLALPGGNLKAWKFVRQPREKYDQRVELWFAPEREFLPVRIKLTQVSGDYVDQQWQGSEKP